MNRIPELYLAIARWGHLSKLNIKKGEKELRNRKGTILQPSSSRAVFCP
jgi:hypothetical protein